MQFITYSVQKYSHRARYRYATSGRETLLPAFTTNDLRKLVWLNVNIACSIWQMTEGIQSIILSQLIHKYTPYKHVPLCTTLDKLLNWYYISINSVTFSLFPWKFVSTTLFTYWIVQVKTILWCYFDFCSTVLNFTCDSPILDIFIISDRYEWLQYRHPANSELFSGYIHYVNEMKQNDL